MGVQTMKYRATDGCRTPKHKDSGSTAAHDYETVEKTLELRSLYIVGGYSWWDWVSIIPVEAGNRAQQGIPGPAGGKHKSS